MLGTYRMFYIQSNRLFLSNTTPIPDAGICLQFLHTQSTVSLDCQFLMHVIVDVFPRAETFGAQPRDVGVDFGEMTSRGG